LKGTHEKAKCTKRHQDLKGKREAGKETNQGLLLVIWCAKKYFFSFFLAVGVCCGVCVCGSGLALKARIPFFLLLLLLVVMGIVSVFFFRSLILSPSLFFLVLCLEMMEGQL
jgi:hypothetical protein